MTPARHAGVRIGVLALLAAGSCGGARATPANAPTPVALATQVTGEGRPPLGVVSRQGDARGAVAVAVTTEGIAPERGAVPAVALAALVEGRLAARGVVGTVVVGGWASWRASALVATPSDATRVIEDIRAALLAPVDEHEPALTDVARKLDALTRRPLPDRTLLDVVRCTGEAFGTGGDSLPSPAELESWRRAAHGLGRVALATAGEDAIATAAATALMRAPTWPTASGAADSEPIDERPVVYDASGELSPGAARIIVTARTATPEQAVAAAPTLGDRHGPLASRLAALEARARVRTVAATVHRDGGCVAATIDVAARDLAFDAASRIATVAALARQELAVELADASVPPDLARSIAMDAGDPRDAAERAAWWLLSGRREGAELRLGLTVGVAPPRDAPGASRPPTADALRSEIDRATLAWHSPAIEARTRIEKGQGEVWLLLASPCGTMAESTQDAGAAATVAIAAATRARSGGDVEVEPFVATDGVGVLAHGRARTGESPQAHARRVADVAARAFAADVLDDDELARARTSLLVHAAELDSRALGALGLALAPAHPSWIEPAGTRFGLESATDEAIEARAASMRMGPLRLAVLANTEESQADLAVRAVDRWVARRPGETRACPPLATPATPRPGTYATDVSPGSPSEALLAEPIPAGEDANLLATWLAAALDGPDGLLARAIGTAAASGPVRASSVSVVGEPRSPALAVRIVASEPAIDAAVARVRTLFDRLRQGGFDESDRARAASAMGRAAVASSLDPRTRTIALWRGPISGAEPSLDALRAFATTTLRDDSLLLVAARPARLDAAGRPFPGREPRTKNQGQAH